MTGLKKEIGLYSLTMVAIGSCIGSGIFLTPSQIAAYLPSVFLILLVWAVGGIVTLTGALTFSELGARYPGAGGVYVYLKEAYGDIFGFLYGWAYLVVINSGAIAALSITFATYLGFLLPLGKNGITITAVLAIICLTLMNIIRVKAGEIFSNIFTGLKLLGIAAVVITGLLLGSPETMTQKGAEMISPVSQVSAFGLALIGVLWSFGGWQHATYLSGEVKNARRTVPRAMITGALVVTAAYLLINLGYLFLLPVSRLAESKSAAADAVSTVFPFGGLVIAGVIAVSVIGTAGIYTLSAPRIYFAMAGDGLFFKSLAYVHKRFHTPVYAILVQSAWAIVLLLFWGTFEDVITYVAFTDWIFFGLAAAAVFVFRSRRSHLSKQGQNGQNSEPEQESGGIGGDVQEKYYQTPGYPLTPAVFILVTVFFVVNTLIEKPAQAWAGLILLSIGCAVFFYFKKRSQ